MIGSELTMEMTYPYQKGPNRLLQGLILVSVAVHMFVFMHISGIYRSKTMQYLELTLEDISKPFSRSIPRPMLRPKTDERPRDVKTIKNVPRPVPEIRQVKIDPVDSGFSDGLMEGIAIPAVSTEGVTDSHIYDIGGILEGAREFSTTKDYYEMVILKIESSKKYPKAAKDMRKEGEVTVGFVLTLYGGVTDVKVIKPCRHLILNEAALQAVHDAVPFPRPPVRLFKKDIPLELNILFELI